MPSTRAGRRLPLRPKQTEALPEPNGSAKVRNWVLSIAAALGILGGAFMWFDSELGALDQRIDGVVERLARVEVLLEVIRAELQELRAERTD